MCFCFLNMPKKKKKVSTSTEMTKNKVKKKKEGKVIAKPKGKSSTKTSKEVQKVKNSDKKVKKVKSNKKDGLLKNNINSKIRKYFIVFSSVFASIFFVFISIQVWIHFNEVHFISLLPAENTAFATEVNLKSIKNSFKFRQWIFSNIINEEKISEVPKSDIGFFMNMDADLSIVKVDDFWMLGLDLKRKDRKSLIKLLNKHVKKIDAKNNMVVLDIFGKDVFLIYIGEFMVFSYDSGSLIDWSKSISKTDNLFYNDLSVLAPNNNYFTPINLLYTRLDFLVQGFMGEIRMNNDFSFENITEGHIDNTVMIGGFDYNDDGVHISLIKNNILSIDSHPKVREAKQSQDMKYMECPNFDIASFAGYDFKEQWVKTQQKFFTFNYSSLQNLSYRFIQDIKEKTDFDIEEDLVFNADKFYCVGMDNGNNNGREYSFIMEVDNSFSDEDFFNKLKIAFVRLAPFTKPVLRNYVLDDGTKASEWIINTEENIEEKTINYKGNAIDIVKFIDRDYPYNLNMSRQKNLVFFGTNTEKMKEILDFYRAGVNAAEEYITTTTIYPNELYEIFDSMDINNDTKKKMRKIFQYIKSANSVKKAEGVYEVYLNF